MTCSAGGQCAGAQSGGGGNVNNQNFTMRYVDVDGDPSTFSSSTATLSLPAGASVLWAGLYWGGSSTNAARNTAWFAVPGGNYEVLTATQLDALNPAYQGFVDVTARVRAAGNGSYRVANVQSTAGGSDVWAGWALVVAYHLDPRPSRALTVADGFVFAGPGNDANLTVSGFLTPPTGTVQAGVGFVAYDGDLGHTGEDFLLNTTRLSDALNPDNNVFNSTVSLLGSRFSAKTPDFVNQLGFDADLLAANGVLGNGSTSASIVLKSASDRYYAGVLLFGTDVFVPRFDAANFRKTVADLNGGAVRPGDVLEYTVTATNVGTDAALSTVIRDTLGANLTYVPGSLRISAGALVGPKTDAALDDAMEYVPGSREVVARVGTGATATAGGRLDVNGSTSIVFRARVTPPAPTGTRVSNQASLACIGQSLGQPITAVSDGDAVLAGEQPTVVTTVSSPISGTVFEDVNYGGGAGRTRVVAAGAPCAGARVELYDAAGGFLGASLTDAAGLYVLDGWASGTYTVRVVNASVLSTRPGAVAGLLPVQTYRTDAASGTPVAVTDRVGGELPARADAAANTTSAPLATLTTATTAPQSVSTVTLGLTPLPGVDFGFNFDTIVNANDAGQGSLRQFLLNANALDNAGLAQAGLPAGFETSVFMVSDGAAHAGLRAGLANLLIGGVARVTLASALPAISDAATRLDGGTQTANVGNTNIVQVGAAIPVGVDNVSTAVLEGPELELRGGGALATGLDVQAADVSVLDLALLGVGVAAGSDASAAIRVGAAAHRVLIERCVLGASAFTFLDPGALRVNADLVRSLGADQGTVRDCLMGYASGSAVALTQGSNGWTLTGATLFGNASGNPTLGQLVIAASSAFSAARSLVHSGEGPGVDAASALGAITLDNLTVRLNGRRTPGGVTPGLRLGGAGGTVSRCVVQDNYGAGVLVLAGASGWTIARNALAGNGSVAALGGGAASGEIGIDLERAGDDGTRGTPPFVTVNDAGDADAGGNTLLNFPVLASAVLANGEFTLSGWAPPGATIEAFVAGGAASGFGEGAAWIATLTEGSASDLDPGTSAYAPPVNGLDQGSDDTNRFRFTLPLPPGVAVGTRLTATATLAGVGTSEFSGVVTVTTGVTLAGSAYADADHDARQDAGESGTGLALWAKLVAAGGTSAAQVASVNPATGAYAFGFVSAGAWSVRLDTSSDPTDVSVDTPPGWLGTENASGTLLATVNATDLSGLGFGLFYGSRVEGSVFRDDGALAGTPNDGVRNGGESGLASVRVRLASGACAGGLCDSTLTDGAGGFALWLPAAAAGSVQVSALGPAGWLATGGTAGSGPGSYDRASQAVTLTSSAGTIRSGLGFGDVPPNGWVAASALGVPGGTAAYHRHTYTAASAGVVSFATSVTPVPPVSGWGLTLWQDLDCDGVLEPGEPALPASLPLGTGERLCVIAKHLAPLGAAAGASETATLTASFAYDNAAPALTGTASLADVTTITLANGLLITKSVDRATASPGNELLYTITYSNPGTVPLSNIVIRDATPPWTVFSDAACAALGSGITGCTLTQQPAVGAMGAVAWSLTGSLLPGGSGSVSFRVRVN